MIERPDVLTLANALREVDSLRGLCLEAADELTRLRAEVEALREEMHSQADVLREVADERDTAIARAEAAEKERDEDRRREYGYSQETVNAIVKERDTLRAELDQLTTWQPIATAPKAKVLLAYRNSQGRWRRVLGRYYEAETLESEHEDSEWAEPGWYEATEAYEYLMPLENDPVLWHPLPDIPTPKEAKP